MFFPQLIGILFDNMYETNETKLQKAANLLALILKSGIEWVQLLEIFTYRIHL